jgi:hypothetical protein
MHRRILPSLIIALAVSASSAQSLKLGGVVHVQDSGDKPLQEAQWVGTKGQSLRLEGFNIDFSPPIPGLGLEYICHLQGVGDTPWMSGGSFCGTRGEERRLEGFAIRLTGSQAPRYDVYYACHLQDEGDTGPVMNGAFCGTRGKSLRVEALEVGVFPKGVLLTPPVGVSTLPTQILLGIDRANRGVPIPQKVDAAANLQCVDHAHEESDPYSPLGFRCDCDSGFASVPGSPYADAWGNPGGDCISLQTDGGRTPIPSPIPPPGPTGGPDVPDPRMPCISGAQHPLSWIVCSYYLVKFARLIDACNKEISDHCGHGDCPYCLQYLHDVGAQNPSDAQMICVRNRDPSAFSKLTTSCVSASWSWLTTRGR